MPLSMRLPAAVFVAGVVAFAALAAPASGAPDTPADNASTPAVEEGPSPEQVALQDYATNTAPHRDLFTAYDAAVANHTAALARLGEVARAATAASARAAVANLQASNAAAIVDTYARNAYMNGDPTVTQLIIESDSTSPGDVLHGVALQKFAGVDLARTANTVLNESNAYAAAAVVAANTAAQQQATTDQAAEEAIRTAAALEDTFGGDETIAYRTRDNLGCPTAWHPGSGPEGVDINALCANAVLNVNPTRATAITAALARLGAPYACDGIGRENEHIYDCSSYVARAYEAAGIQTRINGISRTTHTMLSDTYTFPEVNGALRPGDLVLYDTCPEGEVCDYNHVVMYLGTFEGVEYMAHTNTCGTPAKVEPFWGLEDGDHGRFLSARTVRGA